MFNKLALMMVMMWPAIPMFLIQLHFAVDFWKKLGIWTYFVSVLEWLPVAFIIYTFQGAILYYSIALSFPFFFLGILAIAAGIVLHSWTAKLLGLKATIGLTEIESDIKSERQGLVTSGPFSVVRHPSYWAHTSILIGFFLITGVISVGAIVIIDLAITYFITTKLEDQELVKRFGKQYVEYQMKVPRLFPRVIIRT
jgi:protein-S-isoprenylcysteine O-methyltransferase Ste14